MRVYDDLGTFDESGRRTVDTLSPRNAAWSADEHMTV
jgi:hypothetical protein